MTDRAVIHEIGVVDVGRYPCRGGMAVVALLRSNNVGRRFTTGGHIVMTTGTGANDLCMIDGARRDGRPRRQSRVMTGIALIRGINMGG